MIIRTPATPAAAAATAATAVAAPWRALFLEHLAQMPLPACSVSTLHAADASGAPGLADTTTPRVRTCVCRGLWAALPDNPRNPAPRNPAGIYESDLPVFTTDARMAKAGELCTSSSHAGLGIGGGPIEAVWWAAAAGTQWRIRGRAWMLGPDADGPGTAAATARAAIGKRMRATSITDAGKWSWAREVTAHFGNTTPAMRGSFRNPPPGQPRPAGDGGHDGHSGRDPRLGAPVGDDDLENAAARANFRVCVIVPEEVDQVDLSRDDDPRRWIYTYVGEGGSAVHEGGVVEGGWEKLEVWP